MDDCIELADKGRAWYLCCSYLPNGSCCRDISQWFNAVIWAIRSSRGRIAASGDRLNTAVLLLARRWTSCPNFRNSWKGGSKSLWACGRLCSSLRENWYASGRSLLWPSWIESTVNAAIWECHDSFPLEAFSVPPVGLHGVHLLWIRVCSLYDTVFLFSLGKCCWLWP